MKRPGLVPLGEILRLAEERAVCVPAFDWGFGRPEFFEGILAAARELAAPAVFLVWAGSCRRYGFRALVEMLTRAASRAGAKVALHLDHADAEEDALEAVEAGFGSAMFDGAELPFEENVARTRALVAQVHARGALVEGSLGGIGREGVRSEAHSPTDPEAAARFVNLTGVDILAPSVGNRHGCRGFTVPLDWSLMERLRASVPMPMALHGGSGIELADVARAASFGFRKLNLVTKLQSAYDGAFASAARGPGGWREWSAAGARAVEAIARQYLDALGLAGLAEALG